MRELEIGSFEKSNTIESYKYWFKPYSWAFFYIDEVSGVFAVHSDWGNYSYAWTNHGCKSLKEHLARTRSDSIVTKFSYDNKTNLGEEFDYEKTVEAFKKEIEECSDEDLKQELLSDLEDMDNELGSFDLFYAYLPDSLEEYFEGNVWELAQTSYKGWHKFLVRELIPFFQNELKKELETNEQI